MTDEVTIRGPTDLVAVEGVETEWREVAQEWLLKQRSEKTRATYADAGATSYGGSGSIRRR